MSDMPVTASRQAGIYVRRAREDMGITRSELAALAGVSERLIASLELGDAKGIRLDKLLSVCGAVGLSLCMQRKPSAKAAPAPEQPTPTSLGPSPQPSYDDFLQQFIADYAFNPHQDEGGHPWRQ